VLLSWNRIHYAFPGTSGRHESETKLFVVTMCGTDPLS
jgi:hypothetical protein